MPHVKVFGGGGGVIVPEEIRELEAYGVAKIYSPEDGARLGLQGMINHMVRQLDFPTVRGCDLPISMRLTPDNKHLVANLITAAGGGQGACKTATWPGCGRSLRRRSAAAGCRSSASPAPAARASPP